MRTPAAAALGGEQQQRRYRCSSGGGEMARGRVELGRESPRWGRWCPCKRFTIVACCVNLIVALFLLRWLYSLAVMPKSTERLFSEYQIRRMQKSISVRRVLEPTELIEAVRMLRKEWSKEERRRPNFPQALKQKLAYEILQRLKDLDDGHNVTLQRDAVESWRAGKLEEVIQAIKAKSLQNINISYQEAVMIKRALQSDLHMLLEEIGFWMPAKVVNTEHDDKPANYTELEEEIIPGRALPPECHAELHTDYGGSAVRWGLTHHKESAAECCEACLSQAKRAKPEELKCNIWVYCPSEFGCYSPDKYVHRHQECWLKQADTPRLNFKDEYSERYRSHHPTAPVVVPWISGVISA